MNVIKNNDKAIAAVFFGLTFLFIILSLTNESFFHWVYERHQNQMSWYIRPLFLIPFCFFAYKHSWAGIAITLFGLFTSMFWFSKPAFVSDEVQAFLQFEKEWLYSTWGYEKVLLILTIPLSLILLGLAFWKRSLLMGLGVLVLMATGKIVWSIYNAGDAGKSILTPAIVGLLVCIGLLYLGFKRLEKSPNH